MLSKRLYIFSSHTLTQRDRDLLLNGTVQNTMTRAVLFQQLGGGAGLIPRYSNPAITNYKDQDCSISTDSGGGGRGLMSHAQTQLLLTAMTNAVPFPFIPMPLCSNSAISYHVYSLWNVNYVRTLHVSYLRYDLTLATLIYLWINHGFFNLCVIINVLVGSFPLHLNTSKC